MKNIGVQNTENTCGIVNLANILQDEDILIFIDQDELIPAGVKEMNTIMKYLSYPYNVMPIISSAGYQYKIRKDTFKKTIKDFSTELLKYGEEARYILFVQTGVGETELHSVSLIVRGERMLLSDPTLEYFIEIDSLDDIYNSYKYVTQINGFHNGDGYVSFYEYDA